MNICIDELSQEDMLPGVILDVTVTGTGQALYLYATEEQKKKWLVPIVQGNKLLNRCHRLPGYTHEEFLSDHIVGKM